MAKKLTDSKGKPKPGLHNEWQKIDDYSWNDINQLIDFFIFEFYDTKTQSHEIFASRSHLNVSYLGDKYSHFRLIAEKRPFPVEIETVEDLANQIKELSRGTIDSEDFEEQVMSLIGKL